MILTTIIASMALATSYAPAPRDVAVEVHAAGMDGSVEPTMELQLQQRLGDAFVSHGFTLGEDQAHDRVVVSMRHTDIIDYEVTVHIERNGDAAEADTTSFSCKQCLVVEVQERVLDEVPQIVEALRARTEPDPAPVLVPVPVPAQPEPKPISKPEPTAPGPPKARVIGALGITSAVITVAGLGGAIYGGVLLSKGSNFAPDTEDNEFNLRQVYDRQGWTWLGVGLGTAVVGASLLAVDLTILRRRRASNLAFLPVLERRSAGIALHLRF